MNTLIIQECILIILFKNRHPGPIEGRTVMKIRTADFVSILAVRIVQFIHQSIPTVFVPTPVFLALAWPE